MKQRIGLRIEIAVARVIELYLDSEIIGLLEIASLYNYRHYVSSDLIYTHMQGIRWLNYCYIIMGSEILCNVGSLNRSGGRSH